MSSLNGSSLDSFKDLISTLKGLPMVVMTNVSRLQMAIERCQVLTHLTFLLVIQESINGVLMVSANGLVWDNEHIRR